MNSCFCENPEESRRTRQAILSGAADTNNSSSPRISRLEKPPRSRGW